MKIRLPNWISSLSNYNQGLVFYGYRQRYGLCYAREYVYPVITSHNLEFGTKVKAVIDTTWNNASESFITDMQTYSAAWNNTQHTGREPMRDLSRLNLFIRGCFAAAEAAGFDLSTLTVNNFGGEEGDLLGTEDPNVGNLIIAAGMPACGLDLSELNNPIVGL
jgi:hypothetical protein